MPQQLVNYVDKLQKKCYIHTQMLTFSSMELVSAAIRAEELAANVQFVTDCVAMGFGSQGNCFIPH